MLVVARNTDEDKADILRVKRISWGGGSAAPPAARLERVKLSRLDLDVI